MLEYQKKAARSLLQCTIQGKWGVLFMWVWPDGHADSLFHSKALPVLPKPCSPWRLPSQGSLFGEEGYMFWPTLFPPSYKSLLWKWLTKRLVFVCCFFFLTLGSKLLRIASAIIGAAAKSNKSINDVTLTWGKSPTTPIATVVHLWRSPRVAGLILKLPQWGSIVGVTKRMARLGP